MARRGLPSPLAPDRATALWQECRAYAAAPTQQHTLPPGKRAFAPTTVGNEADLIQRFDLRGQMSRTHLYTVRSSPQPFCATIELPATCCRPASIAAAGSR